MYALYFVLFAAAFSTVHSSECTTSEVFYQDCNICHTCDPTRKVAACTRMACRPGLYDTKGHFLEVLTQSFSKECTPGEKFELGCARCNCSYYGRSGNCDLTNCPNANDLKLFTLDVVPDAESADLKCEPGTSFKSACNTCVCNDAGDSATCTLMICPTDGYVLDDGYDEEVFIGNSE